MKSILKTGLILWLISLTFDLSAKDKFKTFTVTHVIQAPIDQVWEKLGEDFANVSNAHHGFASSSFIDGSTQAGEGAMRICYLNDGQSRFIKEKQINYDPAHYTFVAEVIEGKGLPLASGTNIATYQLTPIDENSCTLTIQVKMRTDPVIFSTLFSGKYQNWMEKYAIGLHHHVRTGETITEETFKAIKDQYQ